MSRPVDWTPLAGGDPVPGDPHRVAEMGRHYSRVAQAIEDAAANLRRLTADDEMRSDAVDTFRDKAGEVADDISRAHTRYAGVGAALTGYAPKLEQAQADSLRALTRARAAQDRLDTARRQADRAREAEQAAPDHAAAEPHRGDRLRAEGAAAEAQGDLDRARSLLAAAVHDRDAAARSAIDAIRDVEDSGDLNDGWWDNWGHKVIEWVQKVASWVALVCGVLALVVGWIPIIGQALAGILGTIALIASLVSLVCNIALASTGYGDWTSVVWDSLSVATFGLGRVFSVTAKAASGGIRGAGRLGAGRLAAQSGGRSLRTLAGSDEVFNLSRSQARGLVRTARRLGRPSLANAVRALRGTPASVAGDWATLRNGASWSGARAAAWPALRSMVVDAIRTSPLTTLNRLYGETHLVEVTRTAQRFATEVRELPEVREAIRYSVGANIAAVSANAAGNANDFREGLGHLRGDDGPDLRLDDGKVGVR